MKKIGKKFKQGAASFYIVVFSTLVLLIVATSFATIIISEIERASNDDLSQSAYDSALAGVEDAKLAFYNYQNCLAQETMNAKCEEIVNYMKNPDCDMVGHILGRIDAGDNGEVAIQETTTAQNNMQQAYTCVKVETELEDYRSTLSSSVQYKVVKLKFQEGVSASQIKKMKISWYTDDDEATRRWQNVSGTNGRVSFPGLTAGVSLPAVPPTISVALVQTAQNFTLEQFTMTQGDTTNRGMIYLVPASTTTQATSDVDDNRKGAWNTTENQNHIGTSAFLSSNDKTATNLPYTVYCDFSGAFACSTVIDIPEPVGGTRNDDTFMFVVALPYGKPTTDFAMEFYCDTECATEVYTDETGTETTRRTSRVSLAGVQVKVDSTGRANDLYRRVETRLESAANDANLSVMGPLELTAGSTGSGSGSGKYVLQKTEAVTSEWNFPYNWYMK